MVQPLREAGGAGERVRAGPLGQAVGFILREWRFRDLGAPSEQAECRRDQRGDVKGMGPRVGTVEAGRSTLENQQPWPVGWVQGVWQR